MCKEYLKLHGLLNPLYSKFKRLGCYWCPKQNNEAFNTLKEYYPDLWKKTIDLDRESRLLSNHGIPFLDEESKP
jgi:3'-phosphoadenosine 5'-phosphosulfate sulfotransferase (PAPS reductase)/FAD synthetase